MSNFVHVPTGKPVLGLIPIIYADPPWEYRQKGRGAAANHYTTAPTGKIAEIPVDSLAAPTALLFMWATWPNLWEALDLGHRWGFAYKTCAFNWIKLTKDGKPHVRGGSYVRANSEPCLLFARGKAASLVLDHGVNQIVMTYGEEALPTQDVLSVPGEHSAKPVEVRDRIIQLVGSQVPCAELFARDTDPRFESFGNEPGVNYSLRVAA